MNKKAQEQLISNQSIIEQPKKSKAWIWILIIVILVVGVGFYFLKSAGTSTNNSTTNTSAKGTLDLSSIKCDGSTSLLNFPKGYGLARLETLESNKQKVLDLKSGNELVKEIYQLPLTVLETKIFSESADTDMGPSSSESAIDSSMAEFLVVLNSVDSEVLNSFSDSLIDLNVNWNLVYVNNQDSVQAVSYTCSISEL